MKEDHHGSVWDDHVRLRDTLGEIKGKFLLSYNDCPEIRELYKGYRMFSFKRIHGMAQRFEAGKEYPELLIANYEFYERQRTPMQMDLFMPGEEELERILKEKIVMPKQQKISSLAVLGEISIAGTMIKVEELANVLQVCVDSGAKKVLLPITSAVDLASVPADLIGNFNLIFYSSAEDEVYKALGAE